MGIARETSSVAKPVAMCRQFSYAHIISSSKKSPPHRLRFFLSNRFIDTTDCTISYFNFMFIFRFMLNFEFKVRCCFLEFLLILRLILAKILGQCCLVV